MTDRYLFRRLLVLGGVVVGCVTRRRVNDSSRHGSRKNHVLGQHRQLCHQWLTPHKHHCWIAYSKYSMIDLTFSAIVLLAPVIILVQ